MSDFWSVYIAVITLVNIFACIWLIRWTTKPRPGEAAQGDVTGHVWDDDLKELNNPLPRWWLWLFYITIIFSLIYLALYPGLGKFAGKFGWTQESQYEAEVAAAEEKYGPIFSAFAAKSVEELIQEPAAMQAGQRLFLNYCATCHGSDAQGAFGFPNLADNDWLYGGSPETIKATIRDGRSGTMPAWGAALGDVGVAQVAEYVASLSGRNHDSAQAAEGAKHYAAMCVACHMPDGSGNQALGAPRLNDNIWLYGGSLGSIRKIVSEGKQGSMPPHADFLGDDKIHLLSAYVYSLSAQE